MYGKGFPAENFKNPESFCRSFLNDRDKGSHRRGRWRCLQWMISGFAESGSSSPWTKRLFPLFPDLTAFDGSKDVKSLLQFLFATWIRVHHTIIP
jgi:hypothetical protein